MATKKSYTFTALEDGEKFAIVWGELHAVEQALYRAQVGAPGVYTEEQIAEMTERAEALQSEVDKVRPTED